MSNNSTAVSSGIGLGSAIAVAGTAKCRTIVKSPDTKQNLIVKNLYKCGLGRFLHRSPSRVYVSKYQHRIEAHLSGMG